VPYKSELSSGRILKKIASDPDTRSYLETLSTRGDEEVVVPDGTQGISPSDWLPHNVVAVDGSSHEFPYKNGFPGAELAIITVASVLLKLRDMVKQDSVRRPMDPTIYRTLTPSDAMVSLLPGHNVMLKDEQDPRFTFRSRFYDTLAKNGMLVSHESLLQTYDAIIEDRIQDGGALRNVVCPWRDACEHASGANDAPFRLQRGMNACECGKRRVFSTDALRLQESFNDNGPSGRMFGEARTAIEHLWLLNVLRTFLHYKVDVISEMAFVMDGTLKIDGTPSWLAASLKRAYRRINDELRQKIGTDLCLIGIEKTGNFVEHFKRLDTTARGRGDALPNGWLMLLTSQYIRENIAPGIRPYYDTTYYGRKFFYKTMTGSLICATVPFLRDGDDDVTREPASEAQFPRLRDVLNILDRLVSDRYDDSLIPVIAAHAEVSIPLTQGRRVLEALLTEHMGVQPGPIAMDSRG
jgi:hypothetical protein